MASRTLLATCLLAALLVPMAVQAARQVAPGGGEAYARLHGEKEVQAESGSVESASVQSGEGPPLQASCAAVAGAQLQSASCSKRASLASAATATPDPRLTPSPSMTPPLALAADAIKPVVELNITHVNTEFKNLLGEIKLQLKPLSQERNI